MKVGVTANLSPIFIWRRTSRDFVARLVALWPKKLADTQFRGSFNWCVRSFVIFYPFFLIVVGALVTLC